MRLCSIPARGGSKRIPRKNIRDFCGKPMIAWSIEAAIVSGLFDSIVVSTDDEEIASISRKLGANVPFMRPKELSDDFSGTIPVIVHAINWFNSRNDQLSQVCCLYATAPFINPFDMESALNILLSSPHDKFVFTATSYASPIQRALGLDRSTGRTFMYDSDQFMKRSQDLEPSFHDAAQFYWASANAWLETKNIFEDSIPYLLPRWRVQDIDTEEDFVRAELMHKSFNNFPVDSNV